MSWQDIALSIGSVVFIVALLPSVFSEDKPAAATSAMTGAVLVVFATSYASLGLWVSAAITLITAGLWMTLLIQQLRRRSR